MGEYWKTELPAIFFHGGLLKIHKIISKTGKSSWTSDGHTLKMAGIYNQRHRIAFSGNCSIIYPTAAEPDTYTDLPTLVCLSDVHLSSFARCVTSCSVTSAVTVTAVRP